MIRIQKKVKFPRGVALLAIFSFATCAIARSASAETPTTMLPRPADSFVDAIGMDSHFDHIDSPYVTQWPKVSALLIASGIRHLRDGGDRPRPDALARLNYLGAHGVRHSVGFTIDVTTARIEAGLRKTQPYVDFVEPANEFDGYKAQDPAWAAKLRASQHLIYSTIHANPAYAGIVVLGPAFAHQDRYAEFGAIDDDEDAGNLHWATCNSNPGTESGEGFPRARNFIRASTIAKPYWITETGYNDEVGVRPCAIPDGLIAKFAPRMIAERFNDGQPRVYFYQLVKMPNDRVFGGEGFIDADGEPTPQFTALSSLISALADPGPSVAMKPLRIAIESPAGDVHHTLLQKRDGSYDLLLWREMPGWQGGPGRIGGTLLPVAPVTVDVTVAGARTFTPTYLQFDARWKLRPTTLERHGPLHLTVTDAISVLELR